MRRAAILAVLFLAACTGTPEQRAEKRMVFRAAICDADIPSVQAIIPMAAGGVVLARPGDAEKVIAWANLTQQEAALLAQRCSVVNSKPVAAVMAPEGEKSVATPATER